MIKIVIINHTFQEERFYKRWRCLARDHEDLDVYLLAPAEYEWGKTSSLTYGASKLQQGNSIEEERFHIRLIHMDRHKYRTWTSKDMIEVIDEIKPDIIYHIGLHTQDSVQQLIEYRNKKLPDAKLLVFSMRGRYHTLKKEAGANIARTIAKRLIYRREKAKIARLNSYADAIFCHYPDAVEEFIAEGYKGPIYMQTQVGVDPDIFYKDEAKRDKIRDKYGIGDAFLFGSASRFHYSKGLLEIIAALPKEGNWKYLMMGWGRDNEVEKIKSEISKRGLEDKVILTGYIDTWEDMAEHWNALDCAVHAPLTTSEWEETFSLALVQAMITGLPVIGSSSGSVPYQIGPEGIIVPEGDLGALRSEMESMINDSKRREEIGEAMHRRAKNAFSIYHLNDLFYATIKDIINGTYDESKTDMASWMGDEE